MKRTTDAEFQEMAVLLKRGLTQSEVARQLHVSRQAISLRMQRAPAELRRAVRRHIATRKHAQEELTTMLDAIKRDAPEYFATGMARCKKVLANKAVVIVTIRMPPLPEKKT